MSFACLVLAGLMSLLLGTAAFTWGLDCYSEAVEYGAAELQCISIESAGAEISVAPSTDADVHISLTGHSHRRYDLEVAELDGELSIKLLSDNPAGCYLTRPALLLTVLIPKSYNSDLTLSSAAGTVTISSQKFRQLTADLAAGSFTTERVEWSSAAIHSAAALITLNGTRGSIRVQSASADVRVEILELGELTEIKTDTGDVRIDFPPHSYFTFTAVSRAGAVTSGFPAASLASRDRRTISGAFGDLSSSQVQINSGSGKIWLYRP